MTHQSNGLSNVELITTPFTVIKRVAARDHHEITKLANQAHWLNAAGKTIPCSNKIRIPKFISYSRDPLTGDAALVMERLRLNPDFRHVSGEWNVNHEVATAYFARTFTRYTSSETNDREYRNFIATLVTPRLVKLIGSIATPALMPLPSMLHNLLFHPDVVSGMIAAVSGCHGDFTLDNIHECADTGDMVILDPNFYMGGWNTVLLDYAWFQWSCHKHGLHPGRRFTSHILANHGADGLTLMNLLTLTCAIRATAYALDRDRPELVALGVEFINKSYQELAGQILNERH